MGFRDSIKKWLPSWLQDGVAERLTYDIGLGIDAVVEKLTQAVQSHNPIKAAASALQYIALDRLIQRGLFGESDDSFRARLQRADDDWQLAGGPWMVLRQSLGVVLSSKPFARVVASIYTPTGTLVQSLWYFFDAGDDTTKPPQRIPAIVNWDWDSLSPTNVAAWAWWRGWLIVDSIAPNAWCGPAPFKWGAPGVKWGKRPDASWGLNVPPSVGATFRSVLSLWKREGSWVRNIIINFDPNLFLPGEAVNGGTNPDGTFGRWSKIVNGQYVPSRYPGARYLQGVV